MKGKSNFTKSECVILMRLIKRKVNSNRLEQKKIRGEMRDMDFYISDFTDKKGFDVDDFSQLIEDGKITIVEDEDISIEDDRSQELSNKSQSISLHSMDQYYVKNLKTLWHTATYVYNSPLRGTLQHLADDIENS